MNGYRAYTERYMGAWRVMVQVCRESQPAPMLGKGGIPLAFSSRLEAETARADTLLNFMNGTPIRGETFEIEKPSTAARAKAEMLFLGGGRVVEVERLETAR